MGWDTSYSCIFKREDAKDILRKLSALLDEKSKRRLDHLDWVPTFEEHGKLHIGEDAIAASGVLGYKKPYYGDVLAFAINLEPEWQSEAKHYEFPVENGRTCFGQYTLTVQAGEKYVWLQMETSLKRMHSVMSDSQLMKQMWRDYAEHSNAILAYLETDFSPEEVLYPSGYETIFPDIYSLSFARTSKCLFSVDHFTNYALAHLKPATPKPLIQTPQAKLDAEWAAEVAKWKRWLHRLNPFK